jgi:hypothetical protein
LKAAGPPVMLVRRLLVVLMLCVSVRALAPPLIALETRLSRAS